MANNPNPQVAENLASAGLHLVPFCYYFDHERKEWIKRPTIKGWVEKASFDPDFIQENFIQNPGIPGIATGLSNLVVIDIDVKNGVNGAENFDKLLEENGALPEGTPKTQSPSGGNHYYFMQRKNGERIKSSAGVLAPGVDVRADGGAILAPGALLAEGKLYSPVEGYPDLVEAFGTGSIPEVPEWMVARLAKPKHEEHIVVGKPPTDNYARKALEGECERVATAPNGKRNHALNAAAFSLGQFLQSETLTRPEITDGLLNAALGAGLPRGEALATIASGLNDGERQPRVIPERKKAGNYHLSYGHYSMTKDGLHVGGEAEKGNQVFVSASFEILGASRNSHGSEWGKWLRWQDADGREHTRHISDAALQGDPSSLCATLAGEGLKINRTKQREFASYLSGAIVDGRVTLVSRTGWHNIGEQNIFVLPSETIGPKGSEKVILEISDKGNYAARGTLDDWKAGVAALAAEHSLPILGISTALAGPLLELAGQEGGGLNFYAQSSKGKTTILQAAASVWGKGCMSPGFVRAWKATGNGLEGAAASSSDTCLILDELGIAEARDVAGAVYGLANGSGKTRANRNGDAREPKTWRLLSLSSGEIPLATKLSEDRTRQVRAGQSIRLLDIPADRGFGFGVFDNAGPENDARKLADAIKSAAISAYGTAGPEFVRRMVDSNITGEDIRSMVDEFVSSCLPTGADGQINRAAQRLGLITAAGELATSLGVTPWKEGAVSNAAEWALRQWIDGRGGTEPAEIRQAIETVRLVIQQHGESRFEVIGEAGDTRPVNNRLGWRKGYGDEREWMIPPEIWKSEICAGLDPKFVARTLGERGMLVKPSEGWQSCQRINNTPTRVYVVTSAIFEGAPNDAN